jgi:phage shock protein B
MSDNLTAIVLAALVVLGPTWITFHYLYKFRSSKAMSARDVAAFDALSQTAARMEARMATLERLLDAEAPGWRAAELNGHPPAYQQANP